MVNADPTTADWGDLERELEAWGGSGQVATLWWRDDDAVEATPALKTLFATCTGPLALAVIPAGLQDGLAAVVGGAAGVAVLQHGFAHVNHGRGGERKSEFPDSRDRAVMQSELAEGRRRLTSAFGTRALPVLTPPWNRLGDATLGELKALGFSAVSRYLPRRSREIAGLRQVNTHVDVIDWQGGRGFVGESMALGLFADHLAARRAGRIDADEPTGLLTHHLVHDPATWRFLEKLRDFLAKQPAARLLDPTVVFATGTFPEHI